MSEKGDNMKKTGKELLRLSGDAYMQKLRELVGSERNDCAVRATSIALDIPYWQAHKFYTKEGRYLRSGTSTKWTLGEKARVLFGNRLGYHKSKGTVKTFLKKHPTGSFIVLVANHAFAVKDGHPYGLSLYALGKRIKCYYRVTKVKKEQHNVAA